MINDPAYVWWKHGIIYHIYPRSFYDSNNDGIGDIQGIIQKLDYILELGVGAIWLSPIYKSPQADFGYDISDYYAIDPIFGTMNDFDLLLNECHKRNIKLIMDLVMNHTSDQHEWFQESRLSKDNPKRDWYIWSDKKVNNWMTAFGGSAWQFDSQTKSYYLHSFLKEQPDLNWRNQSMSDEFFNIIEFWLNKGVDGFRLDVINMIVKDKKFRSNPLRFFIPFIQRNIYNRNRKGVFKVLERLRITLDKYEDRMCVGEIYVMPPGSSNLVAKYIKRNKNRLNLAFDFSLIFKSFSARNYYNYLNKWAKKEEKVEWISHVFSNHDLGRNYNRNILKTHKKQKAKIDAMLQFTAKGTPFIYYGDELGMKNSKIIKSKIEDPLGKKFWPFYNGRDKCRTPMLWNENKNGGFSEADPWLPVDIWGSVKGVEIQKTTKNSMLNYYKQLANIRNKYKSLQKGTWTPYIKGIDGILAYYRIYNDERMLVILNFTNSIKNVKLPQGNSYIAIGSIDHELNESQFQDNIVLIGYDGVILNEIKMI